MNCRPGDLAIVRIQPGRVGREHNDKIVRCVALFYGADADDPAWVVEPRLIPYEACRDASLRPIRGQPGQDETLTWAPVPATPVKEFA